MSNEDKILQAYGAEIEHRVRTEMKIEQLTEKLDKLAGMVEKMVNNSNELIKESSEAFRRAQAALNNTDKIDKELEKICLEIDKLQRSEEKFKELQDTISGFKKLIWSMAVAFSLPIGGMLINMVAAEDPTIKHEQPQQQKQR